MAKIGSLSFISVPSSAADLCAEDVEIFTRPGLDGHGARKLGKRSAQTTVDVAADVHGASAGDELIAAAKVQQGTIVAIVTDLDGVRNNVLVVHVEVIDVQVCAISVGGISGGNTLVQLRYTLLQLEAGSSLSGAGSFPGVTPVLPLSGQDLSSLVMR